jgi:phage tail P2-like protein
MSRDLLPANATPLERALAETIARLSDVAVPIRDVWNPKNCRTELLPWLAWALSVDHWEASWSEPHKRAVIQAAIAVHRHKGTPFAVESLLQALGYSATVEEWPQYGGDPYRFKVAAHGRMAQEDYSSFVWAILRAKNTRSHLDAIVVPVSDSVEVSVGGLAQVGLCIAASIRVGVTLEQMLARASGLARLGNQIWARLPMPVVSIEPMPEYSAGLVRWGRPITVGV